MEDFYNNNKLNDDQERRLKRIRLLRHKHTLEIREIRKTGIFVGMALLFYIIVGNILPLSLGMLGLYDEYASIPMFQYLIDIFCTIIGLLFPFLLIAKRVSKKNEHEIIPYEFPRNKSVTIRAIIAGFGCCMLGDLLTSYLNIIISMFGVDYSMPNIHTPEGIYGFIVSFVRIALLAAIIEELCFRGTTLQSLRKYGVSFAAIMSAIVFGIMHGNFLQAPFAFIAGIGLAYVCIITNSIWPSIIVHFCNNFISLAITYIIGDGELQDHMGLASFYAIVMYGSIIIGAICAISLYKEFKYSIDSNRVKTVSRPMEKARAFLLNPTFLLLYVYAIYVSLQYIKK